MKIEDFTCHNLCYQQWVDMYNQKDKECFDLQLKLSRIEELCKELMSENDKLKEKCYKYQNEICPQYSEELQQAYVRANKAERKLEKIEKLCKNQDILRGRQALATTILKIIRGE